MSIRRSLPPFLLTTAVVGAALVAVASPVAAASPAAAAPTTNTSALAAYLVSQLKDGNRYQPVSGSDFVDVGLTVDGGLALAATGSNAANVDAIASYLDSTTGRDYAEYGGKAKNFAGGAAGKLALFAEVAGRNPRSYAGLNLVSLLAANVCTSAQVAADATSCPAVGAYRGVTSTFGQALGIIAQQRVGTASQPAVDFLTSLQRSDGSFPALIPAGTDDEDVDSTALAVQTLALLPAFGPSSDVVTKAVAYLTSAQRGDGSWGPSYNPHSVNSTGLVLQAFQIDAATRDAHAKPIQRGRALLGRLQNADGGLPVADDADQSGSDVRASTQALGGIVGVPFGTVTSTTAVGRSATTVKAARAAATWSVGRLVTGDHVETGGYVTYGSTADEAFGLLATGRQDVTLGKLVGYLSLDTSLRSYVNGENFGDTGSTYVGATAKLATLLELAGRDPRHVGTNRIDLIASLLATQDTTGRFHDVSAFGDYSNVFGQAFGVLALTAAGSSTAAAKARTALAAAQCADGGFPVSFGGSSCTSTADATGLAVQALNATAGGGADATAAPGASPEARGSALRRAVGWLASNQAADGSYAGPGGANIDSTAYAALGLLGVGQDAAKPRSFLVGSARPDGGLPVNPGGASDVLATAQALPALAGLSFLQLTPSVLTAAKTVPAAG